VDSLFLFGGVALLAVLGVPLLILAVLVVVAGRSGEPDPNGWRPYVNYLAGMTFIALFVTLFAAFATVAALVDIPVNTDDTSFAVVGRASGSSSPSFEISGDPSESLSGSSSSKADDVAVRTAVQAGLVAIAGAAVLWFHHRRLRALVATSGFGESNAWRAYLAYLYAVCFFAVLIVLFGAASSAYGVFRAVAPGVAGNDKAGAGVAQLVSSGLLALAAGAIFRRFWDETRHRAVPVTPAV
jgi:hypothetical protein